MPQDRLVDRLCRALEQGGRLRTFWDGAAANCPSELGADVYSYLAADERELADSLRALADAAREGSHGRACAGPGSGTGKSKAGHDLFREMAGRFKGRGQACVEGLSQVSDAMDMLRLNIAFLEEWADEARELGDEPERSMVGRLLDLRRSHYVLLHDLQFTFEDKDGWDLDDERDSLDRP